MDVEGFYNIPFLTRGLPWSAWNYLSGCVGWLDGTGEEEPWRVCFGRARGGWLSCHEITFWHPVQQTRRDVLRTRDTTKFWSPRCMAAISTSWRRCWSSHKDQVPLKLEYMRQSTNNKDQIINSGEKSLIIQSYMLFRSERSRANLFVVAGAAVFWGISDVTMTVGLSGMLLPHGVGPRDLF